MTLPTDPSSSWFARAKRALAGRLPGRGGASAPARDEGDEPRGYDPFDPAEPEAGMDGAEALGSEASTGFVDVTDATLSDMRQENAHSLDRDIDDAFFWSDARPDAVAGMAKVYLKARCPTPYWQALVASNSYALWGAVALARELARSLGQDCARAHLAPIALSSLRDQAELLSRRPSKRGQAENDLERAEGLALPGMPLGDAHKHAALRALFAAVASDRPIDWPDLPPRLGHDDPIPSRLPGLSLDLNTLKARVVDVDRQEAEAFWTGAFERSEPRVLMVPDWASWMLAEGEARPFAKVPGLWGPKARRRRRSL